MTTIKNLSLHTSNQLQLPETSWHKRTYCPTVAFLAGQSRLLKKISNNIMFSTIKNKIVT